MSTQSFKIWVDADACPVTIRDILFRAAIREQILVTLVANQFIKTPRSDYIRMLQVAQGFDLADHAIAERVGEGDLVITSDIPLAAEVIAKNALALSPRGELFNKANISARLNMRDFMDTLRGSGVQGGGPPPLGQRDRQTFANHLARIFHKGGPV